MHWRERSRSPRPRVISPSPQRKSVQRILKMCSKAPKCLPIRGNRRATALSSSTIDRTKLIDPKIIIEEPENAKFLTVSRISTLAQKLARHCYFGEEVLKKCTVMGYKKDNTPALPVREVSELKQKIFSLLPEFWNSPEEYESTWTRCTASVGQLCKRLR